MRFWWVNQGQTYRAEHSLGIMWAPYKNNKGKSFVHWAHMDEVAVDDIVVNYANLKIVGISRVVRAARPSENPHPPRPGAEWLAAGREVKLETHFLDLPIGLHEIPEALRIQSSGPGTAFDRTGKVSFGYLFTLPEAAALWILSRAGLLERDEAVLEGNPPAGQEANYDLVVHIDETDGSRTVAYRKEHSFLTKHLFGQEATAACDICGRTFPRGLLVAAHIKPRSECSHEERLNHNVMMRACVFGCDALYERGYITVDSGGRIVPGAAAQTGPDLEHVISSLKGRQVASHNEKSSSFFEWHAERYKAPSIAQRR